MEKYFMHQIKRTNGTIDKGIVVKDSYETAKQSYHAYLGAYAYGQDPNTDYVSCMITGASEPYCFPKPGLRPRSRKPN